MYKEQGRERQIFFVYVCVVFFFFLYVQEFVLWCLWKDLEVCDCTKFDQKAQHTLSWSTHWLPLGAVQPW
jgi:hypothetical protein